MPSDKDYLTAKKQALLNHCLPLPDKTTLPVYARNVIGVGIGPRIKANKLRDEQCIRFYVEKKIRPRTAIHPDFRIPPKLGKIPTDVIETGRFVSFQVAGPGAAIGVDYK